MTGTLAPARRAEAASAPDAEPGFEVYEPEFEAVPGRYARLALVAETDAHEGPVYVPGEDALYFTTVPRAPGGPAPGGPQAVIRRLALDGCSFPVEPSCLSTLRAPVHMPNGMTISHDGCLVVCEQGTRSERARVSRVDPRTGRADSLVDSWGGLPLNSPNDVEGPLVGREGQPVRLVKRVGDHRQTAGPGIEAVHVVPDPRLGPEPLQVTVAGVGEPDRAVVADHYVVR